MPEILLVADVPWVVNNARVAFDDADYTLDVQDDPRLAAETWQERRHRVVITDLQVGSMGGMAITRTLRDAAAVDGEMAPITVILLDRDADSFLAGRAGADAWIRKPFPPLDLRAIVDALLGDPASVPNGDG